MGGILHTAEMGTEKAPPRIDIDRILHPRSVAVLGASNSMDKFGGRIMHFLVRHGFAGEIFPINPRREEIAGRTAFRQIADVPTAPDVAILAVPTDHLINSVEEAAQAGVGCCVIIATGFAEAGDEGVDRQAMLVRIAAESGMRIVGPNCMGLIVPHHRMALCSSVLLDTDWLGDGRIALVSQSGALMVSIFDRARTDGIGLRYGISLGNQSDLEICDFLEYLIDEPGTAAICLYIEGLMDGARFHAAAARCRAAGKPLLAVKTGRTQAGVAAVRSHTASLAGSFEAFAAVCREQGVVLATDPDDMVRAAHFLIHHPGHRPPGVAVLSGSGGGTGIASDRIIEMGMPLASLRPETCAALETMLLPPQARNPIDLGGRRQGDEVDISHDATRLLLADPEVGSGLAVLTSMPFYAERAGRIGAAARDCGKPVAIVVTPGAAADPARRAVREAGMICFHRLEEGLSVLRLIADYDALAGRSHEKPLRPKDLPRPAALAGLRPGAQSDAEVKRVLSLYGVQLVRERIAASVDDVGRAAQTLGFPVALKVISREVLHKSDVGAVHLGLGDVDAATDAAREMFGRVCAAQPEARIDGFSVQEMARGEAEVIVGVRRDVQFGPIVVLGLGGIAVEILRDVAVAPAPVSRATVRGLIAGLRSAPLFFGARGRRPLDVEAIGDVVERMSWLASDLGSRLVDLEINPLIVGAQGMGAVAVDARAELSE